MERLKKQRRCGEAKKDWLRDWELIVTYKAIRLRDPEAEGQNISFRYLVFKDN